jgi:hypothetical protein
MRSFRNRVRAIPLCIALVASMVTGSLFAQDYVNAGLPWHEAVLDSQGRLLAWYHPEKNLGYDKFLSLDWDFLEHKVPKEGKTGLKVYLINSIFDPETLQGIKSTSDIQDIPASFNAHMVDFLLGWYPYSGDEEAPPLVREMLDYHLAHGTTPAQWNWASVPFSTSCDDALEYGGCIRDLPREQNGDFTPGITGGIESDKVGEMGLAYVLFYEMTGERKYLDAGLKCAQALAKHVRPGDGTHTPWPYRLNARTGEVINGEEFGGMIVAPVRLFDELLRLGAGDADKFSKSRDLAWKWILHNQLSGPAKDRWSGYYEDFPKDTENVNDISPMMTAYYILSRDDPSTVDPSWREHVGHLLDWDRELLGRGPFFGAWAIDEQQHPGIPAHLSAECCSRAGLPCRSAGWGAINTMYYEKTHDGAARENAFRSLNYATYFAASDGKIAGTGFSGLANPYWFEDGYADAGRSFTWAMGALPDFAPVGQDHLLRSSTVVQKITYGPRTIEYRTFDKEGTEVLRLSFKPVRIVSGGTALTERGDLKQEGYTMRPLPGGDYVIRINHTSSNQLIVRGE